MIKYAKIINEETKECEVGLGTNTEFYTELGMEEMDVEQSYDGRWYLAEYVPSKPIDEKKAEVRAVRDEYINGIEWRVSRYRDQVVLQIPTTDTEETYMKILQYMQYLRDYPESSETWYEQNPMTWDEWNAQ